MKHKKGALTRSLLALTIAPLLVFGLVVTIVTSHLIYTGLRDEVRYSLDVLVHAAYQTYQLTYPGDFVSDGTRVTKGGQDLSAHVELVDQVKADTGADATLFWGDRRYLTTIRGADGQRAVGTQAEKVVSSTVLQQNKDYFSDRVLVDGTEYFGYYMPVQNIDGATVGMLFVGRPRTQVMQRIDRNILLVCVSAVGILTIAVAVSGYYSKKLLYSLDKTEQFLGEIAGGDLTARIDPYLLDRKDEIGEMGRFAVVLQNSITDLVGKDPLTGLNNRRSCDVVLESLMAENHRKGSVFTAVMGDIDHFKSINDTFGHQVGDQVLRQVAQRLTAHIEHLGFVFRWGGEEFLLIYEDADCAQTLEHLRQLQKQVAAPISCGGHQISVTMTFGLSCCTEGSAVNEIISRADKNLYVGKNQGRNQIVWQ